MQAPRLTRRPTRAALAFSQYPIYSRIMSYLPRPFQRANFATATGRRLITNRATRGQYRTHQHRMQSHRGPVPSAYAQQYMRGLMNRRRRVTRRRS
jgi:hypothetical protein